MQRSGRWMARLPILLLVVLALAVPAIFRTDFWLHTFDMVLINVVLALGLNVILRTGQISLAHAGFMAIGAYTSAQLTVKFGLPFLGGFLAAGLMAAVVALPLGRVILRLKGTYFLLFTFALNEFLYLLSKNVEVLTGGNTGVVGIKPPALPFLAEPLRSKTAFYYLVLVVAGIAIGGINMLYRSPFGRAMNAVRESELLAASTGYNPMQVKVVAFTLGSALAGFGGSLYAHFILYIAPFSFTFWESVNYLLMNIIGGSTAVAGPVLGSLILTPLPEVLRAYVVWQQVLYGVIFILFMRFLPDGVTSLFAPGYRTLVNWLARLGKPAAGQEQPVRRAGEGV